MQRRYLLICGVVFLLAAADAADDVKKELARFEGTWKIISLETEQNKLTEDALKHIQLKLEGDKFTTVDENRETRGTFKPDPTVMSWKCSSARKSKKLFTTESQRTQRKTDVCLLCVLCDSVVKFLS
jgi:uncharacterized protein (TIGR03067 family)